MERYILPLKREIWEHHGAFVKTPIIFFCVIVLALGIALVLGSISTSNIEFNVQDEYNSVSTNSPKADMSVREFDYSDTVIGQRDDVPTTEDENELPFSDQDLNPVAEFIARAPYIVFSGLLFMITVTYLLACLYTDRKNNNILFWKSLPVSETQSVLTKVFVALFLLPAIAWGLALFLSLVILAFMLIVSALSDFSNAVAMVLHHQSIVGTAWQFVGTTLVSTLWIMPVFAWLLCISALAKKSPFLLATIPLVCLIFMERLILGSHWLFDALINYTFAIIPDQQESMFFTPGWHHFGALLSSPQFWLGCVFSAALIWLTIWLRENHFEA